MRTLLTRMAEAVYRISETVSWCIRLVLVFTAIMALLAGVASVWWNFYQMVSLAEYKLFVPRTTP